ncbi:MAG: ABC transporter substrate-binding protein [Deltaproteobacteria bacterium]|nr:ABC transporter substrate-binding protein [Deltaproteobacteria bacterium]
MARKKIQRIIRESVIVLALLAAFGAGDAVGAGERDIVKIGSVMPISGPQATVGLSWARGYEIFADWINDQGGLRIGGRKYKVRMINEDSGMNPEVAASSATKLVHKDGVRFVIGAIIDPCAEAIYGVTGPAGALHILSFLNIPGGPADVSPKRPLKVRLNIHNGMVTPIMYDYLVKAYPGVKTVAMAEMNIGLDVVVADRKKVAERHGIKVLASEFYPLESFDLYPIHTRLLSYRPDAIDIGNSPPDHASLHVKAARELGFRGPIFYHSPMDPAIILRAVGAVKSNDVFGAGVDINSPKNVTNEMRVVAKYWQAKYKEPFVSDSLMAFDVVWALCQAMEKAQSVDPKRVLDALDTMTRPGSLRSVYGPAHMGGLKTLGVNRVLVRPVPLSVIKNGKIDLLSLTLPKLP